MVQMSIRNCHKNLTVSLGITKAHKQTAHALKEDLQFIVEQILNGTLGITIYVLSGFE
jgi:hypothetical protein